MRTDKTLEQNCIFRVHYCDIVYDSEFTQALMKYFNCSKEEVYCEHGDVLYSLTKITGSWDAVIQKVFAVGDEYGVSHQGMAHQYLRVIKMYRTWNDPEDAYRNFLNACAPYVDTSSFEAELFS